VIDAAEAGVGAPMPQLGILFTAVRPLSGVRLRKVGPTILGIFEPEP